MGKILEQKNTHNKEWELSQLLTPSLVFLPRGMETVTYMPFQRHSVH